MNTDLININPFEGDYSIDFEGLTIEGNADRISIYGSFQITRDEEGVAKANRLAQFFMRAAKEGLSILPSNPPAVIDEIKNPFA